MNAVSLRLTKKFPPGGDNNLSVIVKRYEGPTECSGTVPPSLLSSCQNIVDTMPVSTYFTTWGPAHDPLAVMKLPLAYYSRESFRVVSAPGIDTP